MNTKSFSRRAFLQRSIALAAECPVLVGRIADERKIFRPGFERNNLVRNIGRLKTLVRPSAAVSRRETPFILRSHKYQRSDRAQPRGIHD